MEAIIPLRRTNKMLGDAGEYYAVSQFTFAGNLRRRCPMDGRPTTSPLKLVLALFASASKREAIAKAGKRADGSTSTNAANAIGWCLYLRRRKARYGLGQFPYTLQSATPTCPVRGEKMRIPEMGRGEADQRCARKIRK